MPKGKRKGKSGGSAGRNRCEVIGTSDEDSLNDNASVISVASESTIQDDANMVNEEVDDGTPTQEDLFEEKLYEAIDGISQKSAQGRTNCLQAVAGCFTRKYVPELIIDRRLTLCDGIERCLKKGRGAEQASAAQLAPLLCVQLGSCEMTDQICQDLIPLLLFIVNDNSMSTVARAKCCWALGVLSYLGNTDTLVETMRTLQQVFAGSYLKGDGSAPNVLPDVASLHAAALSAWSLLLTIMDIRQSSSLPCVSQLSCLLDSSHLEVRMAAGEAITLMLEQGRLIDEDYEWEATDALVVKLRALATDSHKYRAKKDRKTQRSIFRDILRFVEEDEPPNIQIKFGQEMLSLDSWSRKKQYDAFCQVLGPGMNLHMTENDLLRDILELGEKISPMNVSLSKQSKLERHLMNAANFKARSISRGKNRDKRIAVM